LRPSDLKVTLSSAMCCPQNVQAAIAPEKVTKPTPVAHGLMPCRRSILTPPAGRRNAFRR
jgi:hypothetical protein